MRRVLRNPVFLGVLLALLILWATGAFAATRHVSNIGSDSNKGISTLTAMYTVPFEAAVHI